MIKIRKVKSTVKHWVQLESDKIVKLKNEPAVSQRVSANSLPSTVRLHAWLSKTVGTYSLGNSLCVYVISIHVLPTIPSPTVVIFNGRKFEVILLQSADALSLFDACMSGCILVSIHFYERLTAGFYTLKWMNIENTHYKYISKAFRYFNCTHSQIHVCNSASVVCIHK